MPFRILAILTFFSAISIAQPVLTTVSPNSVPVGSNSIVITLTGTGFAASNVVRWENQNLTTTFVSSTVLQATVQAALLTTAGTFNVRVRQGLISAVFSNPLPIQVTSLQPIPVLTGLTPSSLPPISAPTTVQLQGSNFTSSSVVQSTGGLNYPTNFVSPTVLEATINAPLNTVGTINLLVSNPAPGGGQSTALPLTFQNTTPVITAISPPSVTALDPATTLTITGSGFHSGTQVFFNSTTVPLQIVSITAQQIVATIAELNIQTPNLNGQIRVTNGGNGTPPEVLFPFQVLAPPLSITSLSPSTVIAGAFGMPVSIFGQNFYPACFVRVNGQTFGTIRISSTELRVSLNTSHFAQVGQLSFQVHGNSPPNSSNVAVLNIIPPTLLSISPASISPMPANAPSVTLTLTGIGFAPTTGTFVYADGVFLHALVFSTTHLTCQLTGLVANRAREGGIAITVSNGYESPSNSLALVCGVGENVGTVNLHPVRLFAGQPFSLEIEGGIPSAPFSLIADLLPASPVVLSISPPQVLGVLMGNPVALVDGLGILGPSVPAFLSASANGTPPGGTFSLPNFVAPASPIGIDLALQAAYVDPSSPIGLRLTWTFAPLEL